MYSTEAQYIADPPWGLFIYQSHSARCYRASSHCSKALLPLIVKWKKHNHLALSISAINVTGIWAVVTLFLITAYFSLFPITTTIFAELCYVHRKQNLLDMILQSLLEVILHVHWIQWNESSNSKLNDKKIPLKVFITVIRRKK